MRVGLAVGFCCILALFLHTQRMSSVKPNDDSAKPVEVTRLGVLLEPGTQAFESRAVLNPASYQDGSVTHLFYRAVNADGVSSVGYARLEGPSKLVERLDKPVLAPEFDFERGGMEDPRLTRIGETYYLTYVAYDGQNARIAYATSRDLKSFTKQGVISPSLALEASKKRFEESPGQERYVEGFHYPRQKHGAVMLWDKDGVLFPRLLNGEFAMLHRIIPDAQLATARTLEAFQTSAYWESYLSEISSHVVLDRQLPFEENRLGPGAVPIETAQGWLMIYHGVSYPSGHKTYCAGAALLDLGDPRKVIARLPYPLFGPEEPYEKQGDVDNVVFPTGTALHGDDLCIYYGAADSRICGVKVSFRELGAALVGG